MLLRAVTSQQVTRHTLRCWRGEGGSKVTKVPIDERKIWVRWKGCVGRG